jgi:LysM repeat protein
MLALAIIVPFSVHAGIFQTLTNSTANSALAATPDVVKTNSYLDVPVLSAIQNVDQSARGGGEINAQDGALISTGPVGADEISAVKHSSGEISVYVVRPGDSLSQIAEMFGVTTNTILWANDIPRGKSIQPGDTLVILPIVGVRHIVKSGDTIASIAKKYGANAEEIVSYNQLSSATDISVGETLVIPGGEIQETVSVKTTKATSVKNSPKVGNTSISSSGFLVNPVPSAIKTQGIHGYNAVDLAAPYGTPIRAAAAGQVIVSKPSGWNGGYGVYIVIKSSNGIQTLYSHNSSNAVSVGEYVTQGQTIGYVGSTGKSTGNHVHFEVRGGTNPF